MAKKPKPKTSAMIRAEAAAIMREHAVDLACNRLHPRAAAQKRAIWRENVLVEQLFGHKHGTAPTHAAARRRREGALARMYVSGVISIDELGAAEEIAAAAELIASDVRVRTMSMETRVDHGGRGDGAFWEALGAVRREIAYRAWRVEMGAGVGAIEDIVLRDVGLVEAAATHRMGVRRLRKLLGDGLGRWLTLARETAKRIDDQDLTIAHARLA